MSDSRSDIRQAQADSESDSQPWTTANLEAHTRETLAFEAEIGWGER